MSEVFFNELGMTKPQYNLDIHGGRHGQMTGRMLESIENILLQERPHVVLVYGDTNSTLAGALAAAKLHIPVAHVEAGLRSFNMRMPEEINRILTDKISSVLFTPTVTAQEHLINEGIDPRKIEPVGDIMFDVSKMHSKKILSSGRVMSALNLKRREYILATIHRAENTDALDTLQAIFDGLNQIASHLAVVCPLHPRTHAILRNHGLLDNLSKQLHVIEPLGYLDMLQLEKYAAVIVTDSGGVQKEAFFCNVPCVTLRTETEWTELVASGWNRLVSPSNSQSIAAEVQAAIGRIGEDVQPYGDGNTAKRIVKRLEQSVI
jgi:UDP-GlcNAc3NAcA epimerase